MARSSFRRFLLVGGALAAVAAGAYVKRERMRELLPGGSSPEPYSPPAPPAQSNYDAPGPPANTATPVPAPDPVVVPDPARSDPVEEQAIQADDPQAVEAAVDDAAADAAVDEPGLQAAPEPIDEAAEEQAAAAEAAAIGGSPGEEYVGSEPGEPITEAERPLAEAGEGVSEGQEQAEAELEENATVGDGVSDAERQIEDTIEAASNPAVGETPEGPTPTEDPESDDDISGGDWQTWSGGAVKPQ